MLRAGETFAAFRSTRGSINQLSIKRAWGNAGAAHDGVWHAIAQAGEQSVQGENS
jgi:hypothetical protein